MNNQLKDRLKVVNYVGIAAAVVLVAGAAAFGVYPMIKQGSADIQKSAELKATLTQYEGLSETLAQTEAARKETEQRLKEVEKRIPSSLEASEFNAELTSVAQKAGIRIESMPRQTELLNSDGYKALPVTIVGSGDWESCYRFLVGIKGMNRLSRLDGVEMLIPDRDGKGTLSDRPMCRITVRFSTFFMER